MSRPVLYYIRHGETDWNVEGRLQGRQDIPLNARGRAQASHCGDVLRDLFAREGIDPASFDYVSSPLGRARKTMELARAAMGLPADGYRLALELTEISFGDWESFIATDLVDYIDAHYRTIPERRSRGLSGHSMGGYGTLRIGMKRPETFVAMYAMSSCCLLNRLPSREVVERFVARDNAPADNGFANVAAALAAAWAPNPGKPPAYFDWPYDDDGTELSLIAAKWVANSPLVVVDQFVPSLQRYAAIFLDVGDADGLRVDNQQLDAELTRLGVAHRFELYEGDHVNRVAARFREKLLPFFSAELAFE